MTHFCPVCLLDLKSALAFPVPFACLAVPTRYPWSPTTPGRWVHDEIEPMTEEGLGRWQWRWGEPEQV